MAERPKKKRGLAKASKATREKVARLGGKANTARHTFTQAEAQAAARKRWEGKDEGDGSAVVMEGWK